jgi:type IV fimbrial biogenesis protein FimT
MKMLARRLIVTDIRAFFQFIRRLNNTDHLPINTVYRSIRPAGGSCHESRGTLVPITVTHHQRGMTIVELMVGLTILAIIIGLGVPAFTTMIHNNRVSGATNDLLASLQLARSEAIKRNGTVLIQSKSGTTDWGDGHRIGYDLNGDGDLLDTVGGVDETLRDNEGPKSGVSLVNGSRPQIDFTATGETSAASSFTIDSSERDLVCQRTVAMSISGSTTLTVEDTPCTSGDPH